MKGNNDEEDYIDDAFDEDEDKQDAFANNGTSAANVVGNGQIQNELVDKEVEQVIMKSSSNNDKNKGGGGYGLPADSDDQGDDDDGMMDDDQDEDNDADQEDHDEDDDVQEDDGEPEDDDIDQQIVNITSKNQRANQQLTDEQLAQQQQQQMNNDAILVINNQNNLDQKDRPQTKQVKHRQAASSQGQRAMPVGQQDPRYIQNYTQGYGAQLPQGVNPAGQQYAQYEDPNFNMQQQQQYYDGQMQNNMPQGYQQQPVRNVQSQGALRRNMITNILNNGQGPSQNQTAQGQSSAAGYSLVAADGVPHHLDQFKRKKLREMIFGVKSQPQTQSFNYFQKMQKEDLQNHFRNLKITNNITKDENTRLKTKLQQIQAELNTRDKELEKLTIRLQQSMAQPSTTGDGAPSTKGSSSSHHFAESFIVSQLKKNNRDLKLEVQEKDRLIEQLKRNIKMSKSQEIEIELTVYIDECLRLRQQLEQAHMEKGMLLQQQELGIVNGTQGQMNPQRNMDELANLEEAFRYQEMELQKERENSNNIHLQLMKLSEQKGKLKDKQDANKKRLKKINDLTKQNQRQGNLLEQRTKENQIMKQQMASVSHKMAERERVHGQNRDLVTKNCAQSAQIDRLKRQMEEVENKLKEEQEKKREEKPQTMLRAAQSLGAGRPASVPGRQFGQQQNFNMQQLPAKTPPRAPTAKASAPPKNNDLPQIKTSPPKSDADKAPAPVKAPSPELVVNEQENYAIEEAQVDQEKSQPSARVQEAVVVKEKPVRPSDKGARTKDDDQVELDSDGDDYADDQVVSELPGDRESDEVDASGPGLSSSPAKQNLGGKLDIDADREDQEMNYQIEKSQEEIQEQGYLQNFFECPYEYQKVIFMMVKGDQEGLSESKLYVESQEIFNYYLQCIIEFSQQFDPTETLMIIANDPVRREFIHSAPDEPVPLGYITTDLWPKLGFLPIDPENPGVALIAEFMLNELILKNSNSLDQLNLQHLKELFSGDGEEGEGDGLEGMDEMQAMEAMAAMEMEGYGDEDEDNDDGGEDDYDDDIKEMQNKKASPSPEKKSKQKAADESDGDNYSSEGSDNKMFMDMSDLKRQQNN